MSEVFTVSKNQRFSEKMGVCMVVCKYSSNRTVVYRNVTR